MGFPWIFYGIFMDAGLFLRGFGFIMVPEFPRDVFVYNSHLIGRIGLLPGESVVFDLVVEGGRPQARNAARHLIVGPFSSSEVRVLDNAPVRSLCEEP